MTVTELFANFTANKEANIQAYQALETDFAQYNKYLWRSKATVDKDNFLKSLPLHPNKAVADLFIILHIPSHQKRDTSYAQSDFSKIAPTIDDLTVTDDNDVLAKVHAKIPTGYKKYLLNPFLTKLIRGHVATAEHTSMSLNLDLFSFNIFKSHLADKVLTSKQALKYIADIPYSYYKNTQAEAIIAANYKHLVASKVAKPSIPLLSKLVSTIKPDPEHAILSTFTTTFYSEESVISTIDSFRTATTPMLAIDQSTYQNMATKLNLSLSATFNDDRLAPLHTWVYPYPKSKPANNHMVQVTIGQIAVLNTLIANYPITGPDNLVTLRDFLLAQLTTKSVQSSIVNHRATIQAHQLTLNQLESINVT